MLTKDFNRTFIPAVAAKPEVPYRAAYTVCQQTPAPGHWENKCTRIEIRVGGSVLIPPNGELVVVYDPTGAIDPLTGQTKVIDSYIRVCTPVWVTEGPPGPTYCTKYPEQRYEPAVAGSRARVEMSIALGWNSGANSVVQQGEDCVCTFDMDHVTGAMCGFTASLDDVSSTTRLTHALYFHAGKFQVIEAGKAKTVDAPYEPGDVFKIQRAAGEVTYLHGGHRVYTSRVPSVGEVHVGGALYATSDAIGAYSAAPPGDNADVVVGYPGYGDLQFPAADAGLSVPDFAAPQVINLLDLPGATYTLATANSCGGPVSLTFADGVLATTGVQNTGVCPDSKQSTVLSIQGSGFPFPAGAESLYVGRLLKSYGYGVSSGYNSYVSLLACNQEKTFEYGHYFYSLTPGEIDHNASVVYDTTAIGMIAEAYEAGTLQLVVEVNRASTSTNATYQFSSDYILHIPPAQPKRFYAVVDEYWPVADFDGLGDLAFPANPGVADGVTTIPIQCIASDIFWEPESVIDYEFMKLTSDGMSAFFDETRGYKLGIFSGGEGFTDMTRVGTMKLLPGSGSGGGD